ncbi:MAG: M24 family metallopeptidase, partial [Candidatus Helarchaeota archaeon]|nr:M24 family metallopeptidase [Candidatus Helarchaeota archaeon]
PFDTIIASGPRSAFPHGTSSDKKIKQGDLIIIDLGAKCGGYASDITRTAVLGTPSAKQQELFDVVLNVQQSAIKACLVGENAANIEGQVRKTLTELKFEEYFVHSLGHGIGLDVHELPYVSVKSKDVLAENYVFTVEPGVYIPNFGGVRIEDTLVLKNEGPKILTKAKYTFKI